MRPAAGRTGGGRGGGAARWLRALLGAVTVAVCALLAVLAVRAVRPGAAAGVNAQRVETAVGSAREGAPDPIDPPGEPGAERRAVSGVAGGGPVDAQAIWERVASTGVSRQDLLAALSDAVPGAAGASVRQASRVDELVRRAREDATFAGDLLRALRADPGADERLQWGIALAVVEPEALTDTLAILAGSSDASTRALAYDLIRELPLPPAQLAALGSRLLTAEVDSEGIAAGLAALRESASSGAEGAEIAIETLVAYATCSDSLVRGEGLASLVQAGDSPYVQPALMSALAASDPVVQLAAIEAAVASPLRSAELKDELIRLGLDENAEFEVRAFAVNAVQEFPLTAEQAQLVADIRRGLE